MDLSRVVDLLTTLLTLERAKVPDGVVSEASLIVNGSYNLKFEVPVRTVEVINDSTGQVQFRIPNGPKGSWVPLNAAETMTVGFDYAVIGSAGFKTTPSAAGQAVRVIATR